MTAEYVPEEELIIEQIEIGPMQNFTYIVGSKRTREVAIIDPAWDIDALLARIDERDYKLTAALATHYHPDHVGGSLRAKQDPRARPAYGQATREGLRPQTGS